MRNNNYTFERVEKKYTLTAEQYQSISKMLNGITSEDEYSRSTVSNIYYDTDDFRIVNMSLDRPPYKEKLRLRSYNTPDDESTVFLEIKRKLDGVVYKRRTDLPLKDVDSLLNGKRIAQRQIEREIKRFYDFYKVKPKLALFYDRLALTYDGDKSLRITFDNAIRYRTSELDLRRGSSGTLIFDNDIYIMELKTSRALPLLLTRELTRLGIFASPFSKYGMAYKSLLSRNLNTQGGMLCA